ncbi:diguanylate cyclase [Hwanghaeella grinnelliae]|uniref:Diguanylate cyclase n=1 Tax=Hwanghaeella grinnelliae TaxID=2500179 RepID=A0A437QW90_9PROT|nr:diguanylate cyclase [Hwanghaeella grinnelliae]RVU38693.1 diguanylate cyclase [Hwanghaeella grinnelliae]
MTGTAPTISSRLGAFIVASMVFVALSGATHYIVTAESDRLEQIERSKVQQRLSTLVSRIEAELNANVFLANGLVAYISALGDNYGSRMQAALKAVHDFGRHIKNIGAAPGNRLSYIYPLEGNEAALGLYYPDLPRQWPAVLDAIAKRETVLAGPVTLLQGGEAFISRTPVFWEDGTYWGILSLVLDKESLFTAVGLSAEVDGIRYAVRGKDALGAEGDVFHGDSALFGMDSVQVRLSVPGGEWVAAAIPEGGWQYGQDYLVLAEAVGILSALMIAIGVFSYQRIRTQTFESEKRLRAFQETTREGVIVVDQNGVIEEFNAAAENLFGYTSEEIAGTRADRLLPDLDKVRDSFQAGEGESKSLQVVPGVHRLKGQRRDGSSVPTEVAIGLAEIGNRRFYVVLVRDITLREAHENKLVELATTDGLTHVLNRRAFLEAAEDGFKLMRRYGRPLSLMMIDADHFKLINDNFGHHTGDDVLVRLAEICRESLRVTDKLARFGGEEFIALLPETGVTQAAEVAARLQDKARACDVAADKDGTVRFTVSIGIAGAAGSDETIDDVIKRADAALYDAKEQGRDRTVVASPPA